MFLLTIVFFPNCKADTVKTSLLNIQLFYKSKFKKHTLLTIKYVMLQRIFKY